jgi:hypothetical protein
MRPFMSAKPRQPSRSIRNTQNFHNKPSDFHKTSIRNTQKFLFAKKHGCSLPANRSNVCGENMAFTTWTALYTAMLDKMAAGDASVGTVSINGKTITYKSNKDFLEQLAYVKSQADRESGAFVPRTYAKQGGRGQ